MYCFKTYTPILLFQKCVKSYPVIQMASSVIQKLELRANQADEFVSALKQQLEEMKNKAIAENLELHKKRLTAENMALKKEVEVWKNKLIELEIQNGVKQISVPGENSHTLKEVELTPPVFQSSEIVKENVTKDTLNEIPEKKEKVKKQAKKGSNIESKNKTSEDQPIDVRRLDFRIGRIVNAKKHPDADALYVEEVDLGEEKYRTVVSGLVKHVPLEDMQNRLVMLLCNLKPAKMRGILSEAMVMCASTPEKVEILVPPSNSIPGDMVICKGYEGIPDKELNPKKKIFEQVAPDLKTNDNLIATYKSVPLEVPGKGFIFAKSLQNVQIK